MSVSILKLNTPQHDIKYTNAIVQLDDKVRGSNTAPYLYPQDKTFYHESLAGKTSNVLALAQGKVVGFASLRSMDPWPAYFDKMNVPPALCGMMLVILVDPDWRGQGIAKQLSTTRLELAKQKGFRYLFSTVHPDNLPSIRNLLKLGFKAIAQKPMFSEQLLRSIFYLDLHA